MSIEAFAAPVLPAVSVGPAGPLVAFTRWDRRRALAGQILEFTASIVEPKPGERLPVGRVRRALGLASHLLPPSVESRRSIWSTHSLWSAGSINSFASGVSVLSAFSFGSVLSIGSAGSILSIGSAGSILSIGSAGSVLAIGQAGRDNLTPLVSRTAAVAGVAAVIVAAATA